MHNPLKEAGLSFILGNPRFESKLLAEIMITWALSNSWCPSKSIYLKASPKNSAYFPSPHVSMISFWITLVFRLEDTYHLLTYHLKALGCLSDVLHGLNNTIFRSFIADELMSLVIMGSVFDSCHVKCNAKLQVTVVLSIMMMHLILNHTRRRHSDVLPY